jgi:hypothetical protein
MICKMDFSGDFSVIFSRAKFIKAMGKLCLYLISIVNIGYNKCFLIKNKQIKRDFILILPN